MQPCNIFNFFSFLQSAGSRALQLSAVNRAWCSVDFLWVSAWLKGFFSPTLEVFFSLFTSPFAFLEGVAGLGLLGIIIPNFCLAWRHLNQASSSTWALDFGSACWMWGIFKCLIWIHLIWLRTKHIPNFLKAFGYIESSHQIVLMNSPLNGEHLPEICASGYANPSKPLDANPP